MATQNDDIRRIMTQIFISYRRSDSALATGRIDDRLVERFGRDNVFKDVDSIPLGMDFRQYLAEAVGGCDVLLVVIGERWLEDEDEIGNRRIDNDADYVRIEVETALQRSIPVIPLVLGGARMPRPDDLPTSIRELAYRNATKVRPDPDFAPDINRIINAIKKLKPAQAAASPVDQPALAQPQEETIREAEVEAKRMAAKEEARRKAEAENEAERKSAIEEARRKAEVEAKRMAAKKEARRKADHEERKSATAKRNVARAVERQEPGPAASEDFQPRRPLAAKPAQLILGLFGAAAVVAVVAFVLSGSTDSSTSGEKRGAEVAPVDSDSDGKDRTASSAREVAVAENARNGGEVREESRSASDPGDWDQWGGTSLRNNTPMANNIPINWDYRPNGTGGTNIKWSADLGTNTYGTPVVSGGRVYIGTNNGAGYRPSYPAKVDLGCLLCFNEEDGNFLWQHSSEKLPSGRVHDWPLQGICSTPLVEGDRLWFVTSRGEVLCLDTEGYFDGEDDGPVHDQDASDTDVSDVVWRLDMMAEFGVSQHNMCSCSVTALGDILFVNTSNGLDESHYNLPAPDAPSFMAMNKTTGDVYWTDNSPGTNILHGQWSSPAVGVFAGVPQALFAGGDGILYSFRADRGDGGDPELLWKFDCNPKTSKWILGGEGTRNNLIATPVAYEGLVYIAVGQDPEHGEGEGHLWCIDPTRRGDISPTLAMKVEDGKRVAVPHKRIQAVEEENGEVEVDNPNSGVVWHYSMIDGNEDGEIDFEEEMHRTIGTCAIKDDVLYVADFSGLVHCLDAKGTKDGKPIIHFTYDMLAQSWGSPLIADGHVFIGDEDGDVAIFEFGADNSEPIEEINMGSSIYSTPIVANDVLFIANQTRLFAIEAHSP